MAQLGFLGLGIMGYPMARHLLAVRGPLPGWALEWLARIPEGPLHALPEVSASLLSRALDTAAPGDPRWEPLATRLARVLFWLGRDEQAASTAAAVASHSTDPVLAARMRIQRTSHTSPLHATVMARPMAYDHHTPIGSAR